MPYEAADGIQKDVVVPLCCVLHMIQAAYQSCRSGTDTAGRGGQVMQKKSAQLFDGDDEVINVDSPHLKVNDAFARRLQVSSICSWSAPVLVS